MFDENFFLDIRYFLKKACSLENLTEKNRLCRYLILTRAEIPTKSEKIFWKLKTKIQIFFFNLKYFPIREKSEKIHYRVDAKN